MSGHPAVKAALRNHHFDSLGLPRLYVPDPAQSGRTAVIRDPYARWCGRGDVERRPLIPIFGQVPSAKCPCRSFRSLRSWHPETVVHS